MMLRKSLETLLEAGEVDGNDTDDTELARKHDRDENAALQLPGEVHDNDTDDTELARKHDRDENTALQLPAEVDDNDKDNTELVREHDKHENTALQLPKNSEIATTNGLCALAKISCRIDNMINFPLLGVLYMHKLATDQTNLFEYEPKQRL